MTVVARSQRSNPPLWKRVRLDLEDRLAGGEFGERFPTDRELTDHYGVSRHTVREAVRSLQEDGLIVRLRGRGSFVDETRFEQPLGTMYSLFETIEASGASQESIVITQELVRNAQACVVLGLDPDLALFHLERVRLADGEPLAYDRVWIGPEFARGLESCDFSRTSLYEQLRGSGGHGPTSGTERIRPVVPGPREADHLGLELGEPVLEIDRRTRLADRPLEWRITLIRGDRYTFRADWSLDHGEVHPRLVPR
jgi:GntR family transcriptional regulator